VSAASQVAIRANGLGQHYHIYAKPHDRLLQTIWRGKRQFYRDFQALENINFELARGQTLGVIGRNGAGKSTLLQLICGTLAPTAGTIEVQGRIAALLELGTGFNPEFTGEKTLLSTPLFWGYRKGRSTSVWTRFWRLRTLANLSSSLSKTYSSGMYVRLAFAVAVHVEPDILVVDEALAVGDAFFSSQMHDAHEKNAR
jgi:lipopolysaccharide transport system ATP-binding protein